MKSNQGGRRSGTGSRCRLILAASIGLAGCDALTTPAERDADEVPLEEIIDLRRAGANPLSADGRSTDTLFAHLPADATARLVTFTTTAGQFELTAAKEAKVRAVTDAEAENLVAKVVLRSDTLPTNAIVSAVVGEFRDTVWIPFVQQ